MGKATLILRGCRLYMDGVPIKSKKVDSIAKALLRHNLAIDLGFPAAQGRSWMGGRVIDTTKLFNDP